MSEQNIIEDFLIETFKSQGWNKTYSAVTNWHWSKDASSVYVYLHKGYLFFSGYPSTQGDRNQIMIYLENPEAASEITKYLNKLK